MDGGCPMYDTATDEIHIRAQQALAASPIYALRELRVQAVGDGLVLSGLVSSFYHKQLAQEVVRTVAEGLTVTNSVHVL